MGNTTSIDSQTTGPAALVPAGADDADFLLAVYSSTREEELAQTGWSSDQKSAFLRMQFDAQRRHYLAHYPNAAWQLIVQDGRPIGRMIVDRGTDEILLMDIALLAAHRGTGIGSALVRALLVEAAAAEKPVRLHVESFNPARHLYRRLGFVDVEEYGIYVCMVWNPPGKTLRAGEALEIKRARETVNQGESHVA
ncbi:MAG: family N-acetyltransferase [Phycisphaerales bacterium]|jgi:ribosomal protein S18 acetylase RimI-like enzyme|nr:family N-acetyltransferase [Phycisphaerales bacterium]